MTDDIFNTEFKKRIDKMLNEHRRERAIRKAQQKKKRLYFVNATIATIALILIWILLGV